VSIVETTNDQCPKRGAALNHMTKADDGYGVIQPCEYCQALVQVVQPPITRAGGGRLPPVPSAWPTEERLPDTGLIDRLLALRDEPLTDHMLATRTIGGPEWEAHRHAVDAVLAILVPAMREIVDLTANTAHGSNVIYTPEIEAVIGHVPIRGWRSE